MNFVAWILESVQAKSVSIGRDTVFEAEVFLMKEIKNIRGEVVAYRERHTLLQ